MKVVIQDSAAEVARYGAGLFVRQLAVKPASVFGLATGSTPVALYDELIALHCRGDLSFAKATSFNLDEYLGLAPEHPQSYRSFMDARLFAHVDFVAEQTHVPAGDAVDPVAACGAYEAAIAAAGGIDLQLLGIGRNGHIGFNEPSSSLGSRTRVKTLTAATVADNARFFREGETQPQLALTMGIATILEAKSVLLLATGAAKAEAVAAMVEGPLTAACPASALQMHPHVTVVVDGAAAGGLRDPDFYRRIEAENQALEGRLAALADRGS